MLLGLKQQKVDEDKKTFDGMIATTQELISSTIMKLKNVITNHNDFIHFIDTMNLYELYRWNTLKVEYNNVKKIFNVNKKLYRKLSELYGDVISYYTEDMITKYNNMMKNIGNMNEDMMYTFIQLKKKHKDVYHKSYQYIKNENIIKVENINENNKDVLLDLYQNYIDSKFINKMIASHKTNKFIIESNNHTKP